jgi:hypothetical protein
MPRRGEEIKDLPKKQAVARPKPAPVRPDDRAVRPVPPPAPRLVVGEGPKKPAVWARDRKVDEFARQVAAGRIQGRRGLEAVQRLGLSVEEKRRLQELTRQYSSGVQDDVGRHLARGTVSALASAVTLPVLGQTERETRSAVAQNVRTLGGNPPPATDTPVGGMNWWLPGLGPARGASSKIWNNRRLQKIAEREAKDAAAKVAKAAPKTPEEKLVGSLGSARKIRKQQEMLRSRERAVRAEAVDKALLSAPGEEGRRRALEALKGELPKLQFGALKEHKITAADVSRFEQHIRTHPNLRPYEKLNTERALSRVLRGVVPTKTDVQLLKRAFGEKKALELEQQVTDWKRVSESVVNATNVPRAMKSSYDVSHFFRQGFGYFAGHPIRAVKTLPQALRGAKEANYNKTMGDIYSRPNYDRYQRGGLALTDTENLVTREEAFIGANYAERINPGIPGHPRLQIPIGRGVKASGQIYTGGLNVERADWMDLMIEKGKQAGFDVDNEKFLKISAGTVNTFTGRGSLGSHEAAVKSLNLFLFSPRLIASRLRILFDPRLYAGRGWEGKIARQEARRSAAGMLMFGGTVLMLAKQAGADVGIDPRSADFGKIKVGNTRVDLWGGLQPYVVAAYRILDGEKVNSSTNEVSRVVDEQDGADNYLNRGITVGRDMLENKLGPVPAYLNSYRIGKTFEGEPFNPAVEGAKLFAPIGFESAVDTYRQAGLVPAAVGFGVNAAGLGVNTYGTPEGKRATQHAPAKAKDGPDEWMVKVARYLNRPIDQIPAPLRNARLAQLSVQERQENLKDELGLRREPTDRQKAAIKIDVLVETQPAFRQVERVLRQQIRNPQAAKVLNKWLDEKLGYGLVEEWSRKAGEADAIRKLSRVKVAK